MLFVIIVGFFLFSSFYTDVLWFDQAGFSSVFFTQWRYGILMFAIGLVAMAVPVAIAMLWAYCARPVDAAQNPQLARYQEVLRPLRRLTIVVLPIAVGIFAGVSASSHWQSAALWFNGRGMGHKDPQFHLDATFYMFALPFYQQVLAFVSAVVIVAFVVGVMTHYLYGGFRVVGRDVVLTAGARIQIATTAAFYLLVQAASLWLDQYSTVTDDGGKVTGALYTDTHAVIPIKTILALIAILVAVLFIVTAFLGRWRLPIIGTVLLLVTSLLIGVLYPWGVQRFQVVPSQQALEREYIQRNIHNTRLAYGVQNVKEMPFNATTNAEPGQLRQDAETTANIRILDPSLVQSTFQQLQQYRQYYDFTKLDIDRYSIDKKVQDTVVGVREINPKGLSNSQTWVTNTIVYTHGYGVAAAYGNQRTTDGQPVFLQSGIPSNGKLGKFEPRVYFGENSPEYSIVGAPKSSKPVELDYPTGGDKSGDRAYTTYSGSGGPKLDSVFNRLAYAMKFRSEQILLSKYVNDDSQILYDRDPRVRVKKVAPYLTVDNNAYPSVVDGRLQWIIDGYTTSANFPYSQIVSMKNATSDAQDPNAAFSRDDINYIRNSVKATVDAYSGKVTLYAWDTEDPILKAWQKVYPGTIKPMSDMSAGLMSHVRYPEDLFKVQRSILGTYHMTDADSFYQDEDAWRTPDDPTSSSSDSNTKTMPPYYLTMQLPGTKKPAYSLYSTYIPKSASSQTSRNILRGYLGVNSDAGDEKGKRASSYGQLTMLQIPNDNIPSPGLVQQNFKTNPEVATQLSLLSRGQTSVEYGNLLTVPVGGGLLYVEPVYVKATGNGSYPLLRRVLVAFGDKIAFEDTLDQALNKIFGGDSGATAGDTTVAGDSTDASATDSQTPQPSTPSTGTSSDALKQAIADATQALQDRTDAYKRGDMVAAAQADERLQDAIKKADEAEKAQTH